MYRDDSSITDISQVRQSACITVDKEIKTEGEFGNLKVPGGEYAVSSFEIDESQFGDTWDQICLWLAESGFQATDSFPYELYHQDPDEHPERKFVLHICSPVKHLK